MYYAQSVLVNKISASELSRKFVKGALLVGQQGRLIRRPDGSCSWQKKIASFSNWVAGGGGPTKQ